MNDRVEQLDRKDLKILAYRERVSSLTYEYEEKIAELRIDLTLKDEEVNQLRASLAELAPAEDIENVEAQEK